MAGKSTNRFGMYAQQVGYQVGDFFVQVQSGTSALVAFGQQGTQLAGVMYLPGSHWCCSRYFTCCWYYVITYSSASTEGGKRVC